MKKYLFFIVLFVSLTISLFGTEIFVDGNNTQGPWYGTEAHPYQFIQDAIDIANDGDTITVVDYDAYCENLQVINKSITLRSESGNPENCIIDGGNLGNVVEVDNNSNSDKFFKISGFTIKNSITYKGIYAHKSIYIYSNLNVEISNNIIQDIKCGINLLRVSNGVVKDNTIINYSQIEESYGIDLDYVNNVIIDGNFVNNFWLNIILLSTDGKVINNKIEIVFDTESNGIRIQDYSDVDIINNLLLISSNTYVMTGIYNSSEGDQKIINNTIIGFGDETVGYDVGEFTTTEKFVNNIMWNLEHNIYVGFTVFEVNYCCYNGTIPPQCEPLENHNIIDDDPLFTPEYHLSENSPCINTGDPDTDNDGEDWFYDEDDRDLDGSRKDIGCYPFLHDYDIKHFHKGWNWTSFPILDIEPGEEFQYADDFLKDEENEPTIPHFTWIKGKRKIEEEWVFMNITYDPEEPEPWSYFDDFENKLYRHEGYKIEVTNDSGEDYFIVNGERIESNYPLDFEDRILHWYGYYLPYNQNIKDAFYPNWEDVYMVKSEDWVYFCGQQQRGIKPDPVPWGMTPEGKTMVYGKAYEIKMKEEVTGFTWYDSRIIEDPGKKGRTQFFTYNEKSDYEAIEIDSISGIENITEIGVFEGETCVGAAVVDTLPVQILVYTNQFNRDGTTLSFQVETGRGIPQIIKNYSVWNFETGEYEMRPLVSGQQEYSVIRLGEGDYEEVTPIQKIVLSNNYPNPFNPNTIIYYSLPEEMKVDLSIYNIKGQKVKTIYKGKAGSGQHSVIWNGRDTNEKPVSSGIYFYKLKADSKELTRKMLLMK